MKQRQRHARHFTQRENNRDLPVLVRVTTGGDLCLKVALDDAAVVNPDSLNGNVPRLSREGLDLADERLATDDSAEDDVLAVEVLGEGRSDLDGGTASGGTASSQRG
jgi:hypothetical protein